MNSTIRHQRLDTLVDEAFMSRVLINDDQAINGLSNNEIVVDLCPRSAEGVILRLDSFSKGLILKLVPNLAFAIRF